MTVFNMRIRSICLLLFVFSAAIGFSSTGWSASGKETLDSGLYKEPFYWYERGTKKQAWMALDEMVVFPERSSRTELKEDVLAGKLHPEAVVTRKNRFIIHLETPDSMDMQSVLERQTAIRTLETVRQISPVFYTDPERDPDAYLVPTGQIVVRFQANFSESQISDIEKKYGLQRVEIFSFSPSTYLYEADDPLRSIEIANDLYESVRSVYAYPNWLRNRLTRAAPDDPLFSDQWHLENTGQGGGAAGEDVNITSLWDTYQGSENEVIGIVDDGLEIDHEDLSPNVVSGQSYDYVDEDSDPTAEKHGTSCAGVAAGRGFNGTGITGAAPYAGLIGHRLLGADTDANEADALSRNNDLIDIYSNSWGPADDGKRLDGPGSLTEDALENGVANGRGGLGSIFIWAGGNGEDDDNSNYDGYANSRYAIAVAASTNDGERAYYSEKGANILVNAPSSGGSLGITTTDRTGADGYDTGNYTSDFGGTSSSTPLVAGVVALMLQANPDLTWRDIRHILVETAEQNDPGDEDWTTNGAGYHINHQYGFGRIDAQAAVDAAIDWVPVDDQATAEGSASPNLSIPDNNSTGITDTITISDNVIVEFVEIYFSAADHSYWGDLEITLVSPDGTESILAESHTSGSGYTYDNWRFGSVRHFGESSLGTWTLKVKDLEADDTGNFQSWTLKIYGTAGPTPPSIVEYPTINYDDNTIDITYDTSDMQNADIESNYAFDPTLNFITAGGSDDIDDIGDNTYRLSMTDIPRFTIFTMTVTNITDNEGYQVTPGAILVNDNDTDGMPDDWEAAYGVDDPGKDPDSDGLINSQELDTDTAPNDADTDDDGMPDGWEVQYGLDPLADDASDDLDGDGYTNLEEYIDGTDPTQEPDNYPPDQPILISPENGENNVSLTPELRADRFSDPDGDGTHLKTEWQISLDGGFSSLVLDVETNEHLTSFDVQELILNIATTYYWRAKFYDDDDGESEWSETYSFTTVAVSAEDADGNGIPDSQEVDDSVDLDANGTPDNEQENIKSVNTVVEGVQIGVEASENVEIEAVQSVDPDNVSDTENRPENMPFGLITFKLTLEAAGDTVTVTVYFSEVVETGAEWYKYDTLNGWQNYTDHATFSNDRLSVVLEIEDGGFGDADGAENGIIIDPSGVAASDRTDDSDGGEGAAGGTQADSGGGGGGCFVTVMLP
jgi:subtilisin-like proprotein convertase family protein